MFEKFGQVAEKMAGSASRRGFLGRFGSGAMALAAALGGLLAFPAKGFCSVDCGDGTACPDSHPNCCAGGACCESGFPHYCASTRKCYATKAAADAACGENNWVLCGRGR